jgi:hypothetical protein
MKRKSQPTYWGTAEATSKGVLTDLLDDDPEYPMYSYLEELDTYLAGVADGPWLVCLDGQTRQLLSKRGRRVLGVFDGPLAEGTAAYVAEVNPRKIRKLIKDVVRLKKAYEDQGFLLALALDERDQLAVRLTRGVVK